MPKLSAAAITQYVNNVGITGNAARIATAIALAESGGNTTSHNPVPPDNSYGLWQINMLGSMGPARRKEFSISKNEDLYDPAINAAAMQKISSGGTNWKPWTTYTSGKYLLYMNSVPTDGTGDGTATVENVSLSTLGSSLTDPATWTRAGFYLLGFLLILLAFVFLGLAGKAKAVANTASAISKAVK